MLNETDNTGYSMTDYERARERARMREKAMHDKVSELYEAEMRGRTQGMEKLIAGMRMTGLSEEQIQAAIRAAGSQ